MNNEKRFQYWLSSQRKVLHLAEPGADKTLCGNSVKNMTAVDEKQGIWTCCRCLSSKELTKGEWKTFVTAQAQGMLCTITT
jgi:ribosomal protein L37AE/L43A